MTFAFQAKEVSIRKGDKELHLIGRLSNRSKVNLILYAFKKIMILDSSVDSIFFKDIVVTGGAGMVVVVLDKYSNRQEIHPEICMDCGQNSHDSSHVYQDLPRLIRSFRNIYVETAEVVEAGQDSFVALAASLDGVYLDKGEYKLYVVYYCGSELNDVVDRETIQADEAKYNSKVFTGHLTSDTIRLIVN